MNCEICGVEFPKKRGGKIYCSRECYKKAKKIRDKAAFKPLEKRIRECVKCGKETKNYKYCSRICRQLDIAKTKAEKNPELIETNPVDDLHTLLSDLDRNRMLIQARIQVLRGNFGIEFTEVNKKFSAHEGFEGMKRDVWNK